ncbi:MAG: BspA family leucine-rich repeat surface protein, partial [Treponema sp.]|nr:BspA family leucine-rich repeat surface protein [Treponema sp.]
MSYMFGDCTDLTSLDVSKFDTSKVTDMYNMFGGCKALISLDVSKFDTSKVTNMALMFKACNNLTTIYAAAGTDWGSIENITSDNMFLNCYSLKGCNNTVYDESKTDITYARIDGLDGKPGYFTIKAAATE